MEQDGQWNIISETPRKVLKQDGKWNSMSERWNKVETKT